ncbi:MAG TPA: hypothetical protein PKL30_04600 [Leptospiraceae bacterium]|nr:hypothetical protein [Leptospiraceae bacterium]HMZ66220.1 hypothetical protein [Leptospiraceae bacterium]HNC58010.1 hypothetical protein [Leptospiraceae bacterium]HNH56153.1 hypothetical protein [Leptospiraceae bacterium]HNL72210.1 hypothetical protein [Leptospiraceae bacterium]
MNFFMKTILPIFLATFWISISEFVRNEFILKNFWVKHYQSLGLVFSTEPLNGAIWGIWSLCFAITIFILTRKFTFWETILFSWLIGFVLMWLVIGNLGVLPFGILPYAIPLSLLEVFLATLILKKLA